MSAFPLKADISEWLIWSDFKQLRFSDCFAGKTDNREMSRVS